MCSDMLLRHVTQVWTRLVSSSQVIYISKQFYTESYCYVYNVLVLYIKRVLGLADMTTYKMILKIQIWIYCIHSIV